MNEIKLLWIDDEVENLKPHFLFLNSRGYETTGATNGRDALDFIQKIEFDVVLLDENMPGLSGIETLQLIKTKKPQLPVIMITKNEEEKIMEDAIGEKISDYLIKPVNPNQILLSLKKIFRHKDLIAQKTTENYQKEFGKLSQEVHSLESYQNWINHFEKLVYWELELESLEDPSMFEIFESQKIESNSLFGKFVERNYLDWIGGNNGPIMSHDLFTKLVLPKLKEFKPTILLVIDNLRLDQWHIIREELNTIYSIESELKYFSILPTTTQYARNAIFAGLKPIDIQKKFPQWWKFDHEEGGKNLFEEDLLKEQFKRLGVNIAFSFHKITQLAQSQQLLKNLQNYMRDNLTVLVYNFVDMISHAKTEMEIIRELAPDNKAYRSLTLSWFRNSQLKKILNKSAELGFQLLLTTDHGTINVKKASPVIGDKETSLNLRYKAGRSITYDSKDVIDLKEPNLLGLPSISLNSQYIFANQNNYFVYKNNFNHYASLFKDTFQHGGVSLEEMIIPFVQLNPKAK